MFCEKCGNQIREDDHFCVKCGETVKKISPNGNMESAQLSIHTVSDNKLSIMFISALILQTLLVILWFLDCVRLGGAVGSGRSMSIHEAFEGLEVISIITVLLCVISGILLLLPILNKNIYIHRRLIFQKVMVFWCLGVFLIWFFYNLIEISREFSGLGFCLTFGGWLYILDSLALIVVLFAISSKTKKINNGNISGNSIRTQ